MQTRTTTREQRGIALYEERGADIEWIAPYTYLVPAAGRDMPYTVDVEMSFCSCPDASIARAKGEETTCKHLYAAEIVSSKRRARRTAKEAA
jgi:predicted nucleic acid-binding Zn finger protein